MTGGGQYDVLLCVGAKEPIGTVKFAKVFQEATRLKLDRTKLLGDWIVCIPGFTLYKYRRLHRSRLSILSINCFGGFISNQFALPFLSPFINLYIDNEDFIKFLREPHTYLNKKLIEQDSAKSYPIAKLGDISLNMLHYKTFLDSVDTWEKRKQRINWYNLFVTMWETDEKRLEQFNELPYGKKACFVPFKSDLDSAWYIDMNLTNHRRFVDAYNEFGQGKVWYYDPFDMLLYGKKTPLIDM